MQKVWFITGCSKGFGLALTEELLTSTNAKVVATARHPESLKERFPQFKDRALFLKLDVTQQDEIDKAVQDALRHFQRIDVLVNNAGYGLLGALEECSMEDIRTQYETNVFGLMAMTKAVLPHMRAQASGHIINFSSIAGLTSGPGMGLYSSTKFAVEGLSEALAAEVDKFGIKVTIIEPGPFRTDFGGESLHLGSSIEEYRDDPASMTKAIKTMHGHQVGDPHKAAKIIIQISDMQDPPLRMLLGNPALERLRQKLDQFTAEVNKNEPITRSADFGPE